MDDAIFASALIEGGVRTLMDGRRIGVPRQVRYVRPPTGVDLFEEGWNLWALVPFVSCVPCSQVRLCWAVCVVAVPWHERPDPVPEGESLLEILEEAYPADLGEWALEIRPPKWRFRWSWLKSGRIPPITEHPVDRPVIDLPTLDWIEQSDVVSECVDMTRVGHVIICLVGYTRNQLFTIADGFALLHASVELQTYPGPRADSVIRLRPGRGSGCEEVKYWSRFWVSPRIGLKTRGHRQDEIRRVVDTVACFLPVEGLPELVQLYADADVLVISNGDRSTEEQVNPSA